MENKKINCFLKMSLYLLLGFPKPSALGPQNQNFKKISLSHLWSHHFVIIRHHKLCFLCTKSRLVIKLTKLKNIQLEKNSEAVSKSIKNELRQ